MPNAILNPTGKVTTGKKAHLAPRRADFRGCRVGLLVTPKQNADVFLEEVGRLLVDREGAAKVTMRRKTSVAEPAADELVDELVGECDVIVTGVGDCGSCSASAVADGIIFENRGVPAAVICSDAFTATGDAMARLRGAPDYSYVTTPHPVAVLNREEIRERAERALPEITATLVAGASRGVA